MKLYQINLPRWTNAGLDYEPAHGEFETACLTFAGGITRLPLFAQGAWKNAEGEVIRDDLVIYHVATDDTDDGRDAWGAIHSAAKRLFPDQVCIFWAEIGTAHID